MLQTLKRDWWKLFIILLVGFGVNLLDYPTIKFFMDSVPKSYQNLMITLLGLITAILTRFIEVVLPAFVHEQKKLWSLAGQYIAATLLLEIPYILVTFIGSPETMKTVYTGLKWPYAFVAFVLMLSFLCAAVKGTNLITGIKTLFTEHLKILIGAFLSYRLARWLILAVTFKVLSLAHVNEDVTMNTAYVIKTIIVIILIYACLHLLKKKAQ